MEDVVCIAVKEEPEDVDDTGEGVGLVQVKSHEDHADSYRSSTTTSGPGETEVWSHSGVPQQHHSHQNTSSISEMTYHQDESVKDSEQQLFPRGMLWLSCMKSDL